MEVIIRADANKYIGMGHIMRTLSIADAFSDVGCQVEFLVADDSISEVIQRRGYKAIVLNSDYINMEEEKWPQTINSDLIIVDSYYVSATYLQSLRAKMQPVCVKLVYIDDVYAFPYPVDILVNYNTYAVPSIYDTLYSCSSVKEPKLILGPAYAPLRSMFREIDKKNQPETVKNIAMNTDKEEIKKIASEDKNIIIHENVIDMKSLISSIDLAISAAGSTLYEISACGVPVITYSLEDNQIPGAEAFERLGLAVNVGDLRNPVTVVHNSVMNGTLDGFAIERILTAAEKLSIDYEQRVAMGKQMQEMIDGFGADRIVQEILKMM